LKQLPIVSFVAQYHAYRFGNADLKNHDGAL